MLIIDNIEEEIETHIRVNAQIPVIGTENPEAERRESGLVLGM